MTVLNEPTKAEMLAIRLLREAVIEKISTEVRTSTIWRRISHV